MAINPISGSNISYISARTATRPAAPAAQQAYGAARSDTVQFSAASTTARKAEAAAAGAADVRAERVAELKAQVQSGTYQVDNQALAHKLLAVL